MRKQRLLKVATAASLVALLAAACGGSSGGSTTSSGGSTFTPPKINAQKELGAGEGSVNVLAWPGYAENGSTDPNVDWVTAFEKDTGCKVNVKTFGTSDEAVQLMRTGEYDVVSASGDASLRLIAAGDVAPVNLDLVPNYADVFDGLKLKPWNSVKGVAYGIPHGRGANLLEWRTDIVKTAPDSLGVMFDQNSPYKGKITAYDSPIYIADAALYLKSTKPELGIKDPYALDDKQFKAAVDLLKQQKSLVGEYWGDYTKQIASFKSGDTVLGFTWQVNTNLAKADGAPVENVKPKEGATGWSDTWMVAAKAKHPNCGYRWMNYIVSPKANAEVAEWFGEAPANKKSCELVSDKTFCDTFHAADESFWTNVYYWNTPIKACLDGRTNVACKDYSEWTKAWTEIKG